MECPKCKKDTCVLVTTQAPRKVRERGGLVPLIFKIIFFPFWLVWRLCFGRKEKYHKKQEWKCNYCGNSFPQKFED